MSISPDEFIENPDPNLTIYASPVKLCPPSKAESAALNRWINRPMGEAGRVAITLQAQRNLCTDRFNCICPEHSDRRRALVDASAPNQVRMLSENEAKAIHKLDWLPVVFGLVIFVCFGDAAVVAIGKWLISTLHLPL